jgi:predicted PurR-regulated permease PerM
VIFIGLALVAVVLQTFAEILRPLSVAMLLAFLTVPLARYSKKKRIPVWISFLGLAMVGIGALSLVGSLIATDAVELAEVFPEYQKRISTGSGPILELARKLGFSLQDVTAEEIGSLAAKWAGAGLRAVRTIFSEALLALVLLMFLIQSRAGLSNMITDRYGAKELDRLQAVFRRIEGDIIAYFSVKSAVSAGTAIATGITLVLFDANFIVVSMLIIFLLNFIPIIGSVVAVLIILILYLLTFGLSVKIVWLALLLMAVQFLFGNIIEPKVTGKRLNVSPIVILISLYVWGWIWGIVGMLLSVPLTILVMVMTKHLSTLKPLEPIAAGDT